MEASLKTIPIPNTPLGREFEKNLIYTNVIDATAEVAKVGKDDMSTGPVCEKQILSALYSTYPLLHLVGKQLGRTAESVVFPEPVYALRKLFEQYIPLRTTDKKGTKHWYGEAAAMGHEVVKSWHGFWQFSEQYQRVLIPENSAMTDEQFAILLVDIFKSSDAELWQAFVRLNPPLNLGMMRSHCTAIEARLKQRVKGQPEAIRAIVDSEMKALSRSSHKLRDIFTFAGPSGVGKTELAKTYAEALSEVNGSGFVFRVFNMEQYADEKAHMHLFGAGSSFTDANLGELTKHAEAYPRTVYLFDEIEKAHHTVIQSLLTLLDTGSALDATTLEEANFSQSVVIFTTNLGQREFSRSQGMGDLDIFDVLQNARLPKSPEAALTPELVNRLRAGTAVRFYPLHAQALLAVAQNSTEAYHHMSSGQLGYEFGENFAALAMLSGLPAPVPRAIMRNIDGAITRAQQQLFSQIDDAKLATIQRLHIDADASIFALTNQQRGLAYVGHNPDVYETLQHLVPRQDVVKLSPDQSHDDLYQLAALPLVVLDGLAFTDDDLTQLITKLRSQDSQVGIVVLCTASQLNHGYVIDHSWMAIGHTQLQSQMPALKRLIHVANTMHSAQLKQLALDYQLELQSIDNGTARFMACEPKFKPIISASRALRGVPGLMSRRPNTRLADVIGLHRAKDELQRVLRWLENPNLLRRHNLPMPTGILLLGPPGTGKTMLARAVAGEADLPFISLNIGEMLSKYVNGTSENIQKAFEAARDIAPCIMFIDEIDALAGKRTDGDNSSSQNAAVNTLLTQLDGLQKSGEPIFVIAATNRAETLDPAVTRSGRLDRPILCDIPNRADRAAFVQFYMRKYKLQFSQADIDEFATLTMGMSGADLEQVFVTALYNLVNALPSSGETEQHVDAAAIREAISHIRFGAPTTGNPQSDESKRQTAAHEAGHLLAQKLLLPEQRIAIATIESRNRALGFVATQRDENAGPQTFDEIKAQLIMLMAGREAEYLLFGHAGMNSGASSDLQQATRIAMYAICALGLDNEFGQVSYGENFSQLASPQERELASARVRAWIEEARDAARSLLQQHREKLEFITDELYRKESVYEAEINSWF
ncbi:MAG: AAA family ATPase [Gammaproteobacteria bacterium]|nr:AAA family ATPase [Gammaproteobacteria bacterium]